MSQTDLSVANGTGALVRADINDHLAALASLSGGATAPATTVANQWWFDTAEGVLKRRNIANTAWVIARDVVNVHRDHGATGDGATDETAAFEAAATEAGLRPVYAPTGTYRIDDAAVADIWIVGDGPGKTILELGSTGTNTLLVATGDIRLRNLTVSDRGRSTLDHTGSPAVYLFEGIDLFDAEWVEFRTDRAVLLQQATLATAGTLLRLHHVTVERVNAPISGEEDDTNIFTALDVRSVDIDWLFGTSLMGRSFVNCTLNQVDVTKYPALASVRHLSVNLFQRNSSAGEIKVCFFQGYQTQFEHVSLIDCFGRWVDIVGNDYDPDSTPLSGDETTLGNEYPSYIRNLHGEYTAANKATAVGRANDEPGTVYLRYCGSMVVEDFTIDYRNLDGLPTSNLLSGVVPRHTNASRRVTVKHGTIMSPRAHAIAVDVSDTLTQNYDPNVLIEDVTITGATNGSRKPINLQIDSATRKFGRIALRDIEAEYSASDTFIELDIGAVTRTVTTVARELRVINCRETTSKSLDKVLFNAFPDYLRAPNTDVSVLAAPGGTTGAGVINVLADMLALVGTYRARKLTLGLATSITTTQTHNAVLALTALPGTELVFNCDNGAGGILEFFADGVNQTVLSLTLKGNDVTFTKSKHRSVDSGSGLTASLVVLNGSGYVLFDTPDVDTAEHFVDSRGPNFSVSGGTVDGITRAILRFHSKRQITAAIEATTGAGNLHLAEFINSVGNVPATLVRGTSVAVGTTTKLGVGNYVLAA